MRSPLLTSSRPYSCKPRTSGLYHGSNTVTPRVWRNWLTRLRHPSCFSAAREATKSIGPERYTRAPVSRPSLRFEPVIPGKDRGTGSKAQARYIRIRELHVLRGLEREAFGVRRIPAAPYTHVRQPGRAKENSPPIHRWAPTVARGESRQGRQTSFVPDGTCPSADPIPT